MTNSHVATKDRPLGRPGSLVGHILDHALAPPSSGVLSPAIAPEFPVMFRRTLLSPIG
jgi:hypothetical protein